MDIHSLSDLLYVLAKQENEVFKSYGIQHRPTIGNQYEGLTAEILNKSIFCDLHLTVARNSFIEGSNTEYDIILADGTGMAVKYSERQFVFKPKQVLAVIQVKKNLYGAEVKDSYENLATIAPFTMESLRKSMYANGQQLRYETRWVNMFQHTKKENLT